MRNSSHWHLKYASALRQATLSEYLAFNSSNALRLSTSCEKSFIQNKWKFRCMRRSLGILCTNLCEDDIKAIQHRRLESQAKSKLDKEKSALKKQLKIHKETVEQLQEDVKMLQTKNYEARGAQEAAEVELFQIKATMKEQIAEAVAHRQREVVREKELLHKQISNLEDELQHMRRPREQLTLLRERHRKLPVTTRDSESLESGDNSAISNADSCHLEEVNEQLEPQFAIYGREEDESGEVWVDVDSDINESIIAEKTCSGENYVSDSGENDHDSGEKMEDDAETGQTLQKNTREYSADVENKMANSMSSEITSSGVTHFSPKNQDSTESMEHEPEIQQLQPNSGEEYADVNNNMEKSVSAKTILSETNDPSFSDKNDVRSGEEMKGKPETRHKLQDLRISLGQGCYCLVSDEKYFQINWKDEYENRCKKVCCKRCSMQGVTARDIKDHSWHKHHGGTYKCPFCVGSRKHYSWRTSIRYHIRHQHPNNQ